MNGDNRTSAAFRLALAGGCALGAMSVATPALAQAAGQGATTGIEEIVVTAQRRAERLEDVPMAVTALTSGALERANVNNMHEIGRIAPGVQINFAGVSTQPAIRGITSLTNGSGNENNIAIYVDGFYVSDNLTINQDLANLQSIQVLKGPQGTLYGRNATGGAILVQTLDPTSELSGKFEGSYARFSEKKLAGYVSAPLSDKVGFIVAGAYRDSDGWINKSDPTNNKLSIGKYNPQKQRSIRSKLKAELTEDFRATLAYNYGLSSDTTGNIFTPFDYINNLAYGSAAGPGNAKACCFGSASGNGKNIAAGKTNEVTLKLEWDTPIGTLTSYSGYNKRRIHNDFDFDGSYLDLTFSEGRARFKAIQQSVDYAITAIDRVDLIIGANYFNEKTFLRNRSFGAGAARPTSFINERGLKTEAYAVYADATFHATDKLSIGVGARYSSDKKDQNFQTLSGAGAFINPYNESSKSFHKVTPRATIRYEVADRTNIYATYSKGFRAGSFNAAASSTAASRLPIAPETIDSFEVGFKTAQTWFRAELAAFYYDYKNLNTSLTIPNPLNPLAPTTIVGNAPKAKVKGLDGLFVATPVEKLNITIGAAYLHARYGTFTNAVGNGINAAGTANVTGQTQDWSGKQMSRAPDFSANLGMDYTVPVGTENGELRLSGNVKYSDSYVINNASLFGPLAPAALRGKQRYRNPKTTLVDGEVIWTEPDGHYWVGVFGKNLTNKSYRLTYNGGAFGDYSSKAQPITYGVKAGYKF